MANGKCFYEFQQQNERMCHRFHLFLIFFVFNFSQEMNPFVFWHKIRIIRFENHIDGKIHNSRYVEKKRLNN